MIPLDIFSLLNGLLGQTGALIKAAVVVAGMVLLLWSAIAHRGAISKMVGIVIIVAAVIWLVQGGLLTASHQVGEALSPTAQSLAPLPLFARKRLAALRDAPRGGPAGETAAAHG